MYIIVEHFHERLSVYPMLAEHLQFMAKDLEHDPDKANYQMTTANTK